MYKNFKYYLMFIITLFFVMTNNVFAKSYNFELIPYNVSTACDLEVDGGQACFEKYLKGELDSYQISNGIVEANENIMLITKITPSSDSELTGIQYVVKHDTSKVDYYVSSYGEEAGILVSPISGENLGYTYNFFPVVTEGRNQKKTWVSNGDPAFWDGSVSILYNAGDALGPLVNPTPLSATFYTVKSDITPGSKITFEFSEDPSETALSNPTSSESAYGVFNSLSLNVLSTVSTDGTLKTLSATGSNSLNYPFGFVASDSTKTNYNFKVPNNVTSVTFTGDSTNENVKSIVGLDTAHNLNVGDNTINIVITAESGDVTTYKIVVRRLSNDATLNSVTPNNEVTFGSITTDTTYSTTVPYKTSSTTVNATTTHADASIQEAQPMVWNITTDNTTNKLNTFYINVDAENCKYTTEEVPGNTCTTKKYTFNITRTAPSKNVKLSKLKVDGVLVPNFDPSVYEYTLDDVPYSKSSLVISAAVEDSLNSITSGTGTQVINVGDNTYKVIVTSEDNITTQEYKIHVHRKSNERMLKTLTVTSSPQGTLSPVFTQTFTGDYTYTYDPNVTNIDITADVKDTNKASVEIVDVTDPNNKQTLVNKTLNSASVNVGIGVTNLEVIVTPEDDDTEPMTYTITLARQKSTNNYLSSLSINPGTINETFSSTKGSYTAVVDANVTSTQVNAVLADQNAKITSITGNTNFHFGAGNNITISVESEEGKTNTYTINVTRKEYDIATLSDLKIGFDGATPTTIQGFDSDTFDYTLYTKNSPLDFNTSNITIEATKTNEYSVLSGDTGTKVVQTGDNTYTITVVSQDGTKTNNYNINIYKQKNEDNETKGVSVAGVAATKNDGDDNNYYVTLPNSKDNIAPSEVIISAANDATVVKVTGNLSLSTTADNLFYYTITSEDGVTENYTIHITREKSTDASISTVYLRLGTEQTATRSCTFTGTNTSCTITVPEGTTEYYLIPSIHDQATVTPVETTKYTMDVNDPNDSIQNRTLTVTAENTSVSKSYTVKVERAKSSNANLGSITLTDVTNGKNVNIPVNNFNANKTSYNITVAGDVEDVKIEATKEDSKATIETTVPQTITLSNYGINQFTINVTAEDGKATKAYVLNITRLEKLDDTLSDLKVEGSTINGFASNTTSYVYSDVPYSKTSLNINAIVNDNKSTETDINAIISEIKVNGNSIAFTQKEDVTVDVPLSTGDNKIEIVVAAQNRNQTKKYEISVNRALNNDNGIQKVEVYFDGALHEAGYNMETGTYDIVVPYNTELIQNTTTNTNGYIKVTPNNGAVATDKLATITMTPTALVTDDSVKGNVNDFTFQVTAEDGTVKDYNMKITRTKNNKSELVRVNVYKGIETSTTTYCVIDEGKTNCTISVPVDTTVFTIEGIIADSSKNATVEFTDGTTMGTNYLLETSQSTKVINAKVTAENGVDTTNYVITIERAKSSNNFLGDLQSNAGTTTMTQVPDFANNKTSYEIEVPGTQSSIDLYVKAEDPKALVKIENMTDTPTDSLTFNTVLNNPGESTTIKFEVTAENGAVLPYTVKVNRLKNTEPRLSGITINGISINNYLEDSTFDSNTFEYTLKELPYQNDKVTVGATSIDTVYGTQTNTGVHNLNTIFYNSDYTNINHYVNTIVIRGYAQDTSIYKDYKINITRAANSDTDIKKVEFMIDGVATEATYDSNEDLYRITVPNNITVANDTNVKVTPNDGKAATDAKATISMNETQLKTNDATNGNVNTHNFIVTAEDGTIKVYTLVVTREKSDNSFLTEILVKDKTGNTVIGSFNPTFKENVYTYTVNVPVTTTDFLVEVDKKEPNAIVTGDGRYTLSQSNLTVTVSVTPENGDPDKVKTYTLNIKREANNNNNLDTIAVVDENNVGYTVIQDTESKNKYKVTIPGEIDTVYINATAESDLATIKYINPTDNPNKYIVPVGKTEVEFQIKSESGASQSYYIEITRSPKKEARLSSLTYTLSDGTVGVFDDFDPDKLEYTIPKVPYGTTGIYITAIPADQDAIVSGKIGNQSIATGDNKYVITVTAQDGETKLDYEINVERAKNDDATLRLLSVNGVAFNETFSSTVFDYTLTVDENKLSIKPSDINAIPKDAKAKITYDPEMLLSTDSINYYKIKVTAEDGVTTKTYTLGILRPKSTDNKLKEVILTGASLSPNFDPDVKEYTVIVPYGQTDFSIEGKANASTSTVYGNGDYSLSNKVINLSVAAEDPNTDINIYKFNIVEAKSNDASLVDLNVSGYPFKGDNPTFITSVTNYNIGDIETSVKKLRVNGTTSNVNAKLNFYNDGDLVTECDNVNSCEITLKSGLGSKVITVEVVAPDEVTKKSYYITYNKVNSTNAYLSNITTDTGTFDKKFNKTTKNYVLTIPYESDSATLTITSENSDASIKVNSDDLAISPKTYKVTNIDPDTPVTVSIIVTAQDGVTKESYNVVVERLPYTGSDDATLESLAVVNYNLSPDFDASTLDYSIGQIPYSLDKLTIMATPNISSSKINYYVNGVPQDSNIVNIPNEDATITVKVTAENGLAVKNYTIKYTKVANNIAYLDDLTVSGGTLTPAFDKNKNIYTVNVDKDTTMIDITANAEDVNSTIKVNGEPYVNSSVKSITGLKPGTNTTTITVTAEDGKTTMTYKLNIIREAESELITSEEYGHTIENNYIMTVAPSKTVLDIKNELDNDNSKLEVWSIDGSSKLTDTDTITTGMTVKLVINNNVSDSKVIIIKGDVNGDGEVDIFDSSDILNHYVGRQQIVGHFLVAGDVTADDEVDIFDSSDILNHYVGRQFIQYK